MLYERYVNNEAVLLPLMCCPDICDTSNNHLRFGEALTILGETTRQVDGNRITHFAVYSGTSELTKVSLIEYTNTNMLTVCVWTFTEPPGSRIRIEILEFFSDKSFSHDYILKVGNGVYPSDGASIAVLDKRLQYPIEVLSVDSGVWIVLISKFAYRSLDRLRIVLTVYNMTGRFISKQYLKT